MRLDQEGDDRGFPIQFGLGSIVEGDDESRRRLGLDHLPDDIDRT